MKKYIFQCRYCGSILFKGDSPIISLMGVEIKCPNNRCGKILMRESDIIVSTEKKLNNKIKKVRYKKH
jgi:hypothetical protein